MNNKQFIATRGKQKEGHYASLYRDKNGNIFSYGLHYPLLFQIGSLWYRNNQGYSNTTSKHIGIAGAYSDVDVEVSYENRGIPTPEKITQYLQDEVNNWQERLDEKKRKNTNIYAWLSAELKDAQENLAKHKENLKNEPGQPKTPQKDNDPAGLKTIAMVASFGNIFGQTQKEKNDWKARMLKAGLENKGFEMPEDWNTLSEDEKETRLNGAINQLKQ